MRFEEQFAALNRLRRDGNFPAHDIAIANQLRDRIPVSALFLAQRRRRSPVETFQGDTNPCPRSPGSKDEASLTRPEIGSDILLQCIGMPLRRRSVAGHKS